MRLRRVYVADPLTAGTSVWVGESAANHITRVLRLERGAALTVFDGRGGEYDAVIAELRRERVQLGIGEWHRIERESPLAITLAQGVARGERMDLVVQKATELGVSRIVPVMTERTVVRLTSAAAEQRLRHWRAVAIAACEQCGRNRLPEITSPVSFAELLAGDAAEAGGPRRSAGARLVLSPSGGLRVRDLQPVTAGLLLLIGPEGGLAEAEHEAALAAGFLALNLGPRILRTETAALAALAAIQQQHGDL